MKKYIVRGMCRYIARSNGDQVEGYTIAQRDFWAMNHDPNFLKDVAALAMSCGDAACGRDVIDLSDVQIVGFVIWDIIEADTKIIVFPQKK
jgi:hypothetical protein